MIETAEVLQVNRENPLIITIRLKAPEIASGVKAGQFLMVKSGESFDPLLRRPISVMEYSAETGEILLLFKIVGIGTSMLFNLRARDFLNIEGPLGNGFDTAVHEDSVHLIAGGTGLTPLYCLAEELRKQNKQVTVFIGAESMKMMLHAEELWRLGCSVHVATLDGSFGFNGSVYELMEQEAEHIKYIYACGANSLMKQVDAFAAARGIPGQLCLEARMACGVGACRVCTCALKGRNGQRVSVCKDGPVFRIGEVEIDG